MKTTRLGSERKGGGMSELDLPESVHNIPILITGNVSLHDE